MTQDNRQQVLAFYWQISEGLTPLCHEYGPAVLVAALVEWVGGSLFLALESGVITEALAREIVERARLYALRDLVEH